MISPLTAAVMAACKAAPPPFTLIVAIAAFATAIASFTSPA